MVVVRGTFCEQRAYAIGGVIQRGEKREHRSNLATTEEVGADSDKYTDCDEEGERRPAMFEERVDGDGCPDGRTDCEFGGEGGR